MELSHPITLRAMRPGMIRTWAQLEGKSPTMSEDLYRRSVRPLRRERNALAAVYSVAHAMAWAFEAWRMFRST